MKKYLLFVLITIVINNLLTAQSNYPKREFRGAWLSTVRNIDWPSSPSNTTETKINNLIKILDYLKSTNINAVIFQVRPACDAMYASTIEPWSSWLTGKQGKAPSPYFDPLEIAVEEAHKRGMELHAWLNPYRVRLASYNLTLDNQNVAKQHPDWVLNINGDEMLDPGLPMVRQHIVNVITDIITRYDVDAIHFDDYFYLEGITNEDDQTFNDYPNGFSNKGDWRRNNVNELMRMIHTTIQSVAPNVKFGQSPAGIWKNGVPEGTWGRDNYSVIYSDPVTWLNEQVIDYLAPQLYWPFGGGQDYGKLAPWWASQRNGRHIYPGLPFYRIDATSSPITDESQIGKMVKLNRATNGIYGEIYFTSHNFDDNNGGITDTLTNNYYRFPALLPVMDWRDTTPPDSPTNLRFDRVPDLGITALTWNVPQNESIKFYVLYRSISPTFSSSDIGDPSNIFTITSNNYVQIDENFPNDNGYFFVTALDNNNNESNVSNKFEFQASIVIPDVPKLVLPVAASNDVRDTTNLVWNYAQNAGSYEFRISKDASFNEIVVSKGSILDTSFQVTGLEGQTNYYWDVIASNFVGASDPSETYSFTTAFPTSPSLLTPTFQEISVELNSTFTWQGDSVSNSFRFQLSEGLSVNSAGMIKDTILNLLSIKVENLEPGTFYAWRVNSTNEFGTSLWSDVFQMKTILILPDIPVLLTPLDNLATVGDSVKLSWRSAAWALKYNLQVSLDSSFNEISLSQKNVVDTFQTVTGLEGETTYYWRVLSVNNSGPSEYSKVFKFRTGFPSVPIILYPTFQQLDREIDPILKWTSIETATDYRVQLYEGLKISVNNLIFDEVTKDTFFTSPTLNVNTIYSWRASAFNSIGNSGWTNISQFKTAKDTILAVNGNKSNIPKIYYLEQNFPNPFNPSTVISFGLPKDGYVSLNVYNILGEEIAELVNDNLNAGNYEFTFYGNNISSGIYIYVLQSNNMHLIKKMVLIK